MRASAANKTAVTNGKSHSAVVGGSTAKLRRKCSGSRIAESAVPRETSLPADRGTALHHVCEIAVTQCLSDTQVMDQFRGVALKQGDMAFTIDLTEDLIRRKVWPALAFVDATIPPEAVLLVEAKLRMEWAAGVPRSRRADFRDIPGASGTGDLVFSMPTRRGVADYKFGEGNIVPAHDNDQGRFYLVSAIMSGVLPVADDYEFWIFQPADKLPAEQHASKAVYTLDDLVAFNHDLHDAMTSEPRYVPGEHCTHCKGKLACAAFMDFTRQVVERMSDISGLPLRELEYWFEMVKPLRDLTYQIERAALRNARNGNPPKGYALVPALGQTVYKDADTAEAALARKGVSVADRRVTSLVSPAKAKELLVAIGTPDKEIDRFMATHTRRPENGETLKRVDDGVKMPSAAEQLGAMLAARGLA